MKIQFTTDNAAFVDDLNGEIEMILKRIIVDMSNGDTEGTIRDTNGNTVGKWKY